MSNLVAIPPGLHLSDARVSSPIVKVGRDSQNPKLLTCYIKNVLKHSTMMENHFKYLIQ